MCTSDFTDIVFVEVLEISQHSEPNKKVGRSQYDATSFVVQRTLDLNADLETGSQHGHDVIDDHHDVPQVDKLSSVVLRQRFPKNPLKILVSLLKIFEAIKSEKVE